MTHNDYPRIYSKFTEKSRNYWIQDAPEEMFPEIMANLTGDYLVDEPSKLFTNCKDDPESLREFKEIWGSILKEKLSIVCLTKDNQDNVKLAGFNLLTQTVVGKVNKYSGTGKAISTLQRISQYVLKVRDFYKEFNLTKCMSSMTLYVLNEYRGNGIGRKLLEAREFVCRRIGIKATFAIFSSNSAQKCAEQVGFQDFYVESYENLGKIDPQMLMENIQGENKIMRCMYKLYD